MSVSRISELQLQFQFFCISFVYHLYFIILSHFLLFHSFYKFLLLFHRENIFLHLVKDDKHHSKVVKVTLRYINSYEQLFIYIYIQLFIYLISIRYKQLFISSYIYISIYMRERERKKELRKKELCSFPFCFNYTIFNLLWVLGALSLLILFYANNTSVDFQHHHFPTVRQAKSPSLRTIIGICCN